MGPVSITRVDPHLHASASACSALTDEEAIAWFTARPEFAVVISDHMTWRFYDSEAARPLRARSLFAIEVTVANLYDFVLLTADLEPFAGLLPEACSQRTTYHEPPLEVFADRRVLVTFAHPPRRDAWRGPRWPAWMTGLPVDFLEFNAARHRGDSNRPTSGGAAGTREALRSLQHDLETLRAECFPQAGFIVGSDGHGPARLGTTYAELDRPAGSASQAWEALRAREFTGLLGLGAEGTWTVDPDLGLRGRE